MILLPQRLVIYASLFATVNLAPQISVQAEEPPTVVIGGPESMGPPVMIDLGAIDEALGHPDAPRLRLHPPGKSKTVTDASAVQLHHPAAPPKKTKLASTETAPPSIATTAMPPAPAPAPEPAKAEPKTEAVKVDTPKVETPAPTKMASLPTAPKTLTPEPTPAPASPAPTPMVTAAVPAAPKPALPEKDTSTVPPGATRVLFAIETDQLQDPAHADLDALVKKFKDGNRPIQIIAYASGSADQSSAARRLSLKRALTIREYLIDKGISRTRLDVRALGNQSGEGPPDRVDIIPDAH